MTLNNILHTTLAGITLAALLMMAGCAVESQTNMGGFVVKLHDAPADYDEVNVFIERVEVNNTTDGQGWQIISEPMRSYNLLELTNGVFEVIADTELEVGTYPQIRLIVSRDQNNVKINGETHGLFIPSGAQTGIKLNVDAEIRDGIVYTLLLDFDALRSVVRTGQASSERFLLKPVIRATNEALTGNISGTIVPIEARAVVYAIAGSDTLSTTFADEVTGEFLLVGLEEGVYDVSVEAREDNYTGSTVNDVDVTVNETTTLEPIVLESE